LSLNPEDLGAPVAIALAIDDGMLADRLAALLGGVAGVRLVARGEPADAVLAMQAPLDTPSDDLGLTPREQEVLALLAEGASNKLIARRLGISVHTAKFHVGSLLNKFDATGRTDAVAHAARLGVLHL
jgi:DNA-binding CsgD family transcriptional regulator